jgi:hypothetical protein
MHFTHDELATIKEAIYTALAERYAALDRESFLLSLPSLANDAAIQQRHDDERERIAPMVAVITRINGVPA